MSIEIYGLDTPPTRGPLQGSHVANRACLDYLQFLGIDSEGDQTKSGAEDKEDFRGKFLQKLAYNNVWVPRPQRPPKHQTVIIFDWDDTLLPTSWLTRHMNQPLHPAVGQHLQDISLRAKSMLETAVRLGHTYIITNAMSGWVWQSAAQWAPELQPILETIPIISARDKFEASFPDDIQEWKVQAFLEVQRQLDSALITNLIALGDADFEMRAASIMAGQFEQALIKTIKFQPHPTPIEHLRQVEVVADKFERIIGAGRSMRVFLERRAGTAPRQ